MFKGLTDSVEWGGPLGVLREQEEGGREEGSKEGNDTEPPSPQVSLHEAACGRPCMKSVVAMAQAA
jgi:hypothetical protein